MNRKARYVVKWWLLGVLIFTSLMPGPVGAHTSQDAPDWTDYHVFAPRAETKRPR